MLQVTGIFTGTVFSPSCSPRQFSSHYTIRARRNLPDKEFRSSTPQDGPCLHPATHSYVVGARRMASSCRGWINRTLASTKGSIVSNGLFGSYLPTSVIVPIRSLLEFLQVENLRTIIVIADIDQGLHSASTSYCYNVPTMVDLLALVRCHPLYILLRVRRELCFW